MEPTGPLWSRTRSRTDDQIPRECATLGVGSCAVIVYLQSRHAPVDMRSRLRDFPHSRAALKRSGWMVEVHHGIP